MVGMVEEVWVCGVVGMSAKLEKPRNRVIMLGENVEVKMKKSSEEIQK